MRILKILLLSSCLAAFGAGAAWAATTPPDTPTGQPTTKPKTTKVVKKRTPTRKHASKTKRTPLKKHTMAKATKPKKTTPSTETAPGSPPGTTTN